MDKELIAQFFKNLRLCAELDRKYENLCPDLKKRRDKERAAIRAKFPMVEKTITFDNPSYAQWLRERIA